MNSTTRRLGVFAAAIAGIAVAGYGSASAGMQHPGGTDAPPETTTPADGTVPVGTDMEMMEPPEFALDWTVEVTSEADGAVVTANQVVIDVVPSGYEFSCDFAGKPVDETHGHYHVLIDHSLVDMSCEESFTLSLQNVAPGEHTIQVEPALNDHVPVLANLVEFTFTYEPSDPLPEITDEVFDGPPTIRIVSPEDGATVSGEFDVVVEVENFNLSCDLFGKPALFGYGHWHANADTAEGPMMGMLTMFGMACETTFHATTAGYEPGETHSIIALLLDNGHAPLMNPEAADFVEVTIGDAAATETTTG